MSALSSGSLPRALCTAAASFPPPPSGQPSCASKPPSLTGPAADRHLGGFRPPALANPAALHILTQAFWGPRSYFIPFNFSSYATNPILHGKCVNTNTLCGLEKGSERTAWLPLGSWRQEQLAGPGSEHGTNSRPRGGSACLPASPLRVCVFSDTEVLRHFLQTTLF